MPTFNDAESGASVRSKINTAITKVDAIEAGATGDQTGTEIVVAIDAELGQEDWKSGGGGTTVDPAWFNTRTAAAAATIDPGVEFLRTVGFEAIGDQGGGLYMDVGVNDPGGGAAFLSADGRYWQLLPENGWINVIQFGAGPAKSAAENHTAFQAALDFATLNAVRTEYASSYKVLIPLVEGFYLIGGDIVVRRNTLIQGGSPSGRGTAVSTLKFTSAADAGFWFRHPGGEASRSDTYTTELGPGDLWGSGRSEMHDVAIMAENPGDIDFGIVHNITTHFSGVVVQGTARAAFFAHGTGSNGTSDYGDPDVVGNSLSTMFGNTNFSTYFSCTAKENLGHGFVASGSNAQSMTYLACDATNNLGCGFRDNSTVGNYYYGGHTAQNTVKIERETGASTTLSADAVADEVVIPVTDASIFEMGDGIRITLDDATVWSGVIGSRDQDHVDGPSIDYVANTIEVNAAPPSLASSGATVIQWRTFMSVEAHTSASTTEPESGANWRNFWTQVTSSLLPDGVWTDATFYKDCGGVNIVEKAANSPSITDHYTEGGIEGGVIPRGNTVVQGGAATAYARVIYVPSESDGVQTFGSPLRNTPPRWRGKDLNDKEFGSALGSIWSGGVLYQCGHSDDPIFSSGLGLVQLKWDGQKYVWRYDGLDMMSFLPEGYNNFEFKFENTALGAFSSKAHAYFEPGLAYGNRANYLQGAYNFTAPSITPTSLPKGTTLTFSHTLASEPHALHVRTGGRIGALTWNAITGEITNGATVSAPEVKAVLDLITPWPAIAKDARSGTATIADASSTVAVSFPTTRASANYAVGTTPHGDERVWITAKATTGFTLNRSGSSGALSVDWTLSPHVNA